MSNDAIFETLVEQCEQTVLELTLATKHMTTMAEHFRNKEVPRASAHYMATLGHLEKVRELMADLAVKHSEKAKP